MCVYCMCVCNFQQRQCSRAETAVLYIYLRVNNYSLLQKWTKNLLILATQWSQRGRYIQYYFSTIQSAFKCTSIQECYSISTIHPEKNVLTTIINGNIILRINCQGVSQPAAVMAHVEPVPPADNGGYNWAEAALKKNRCLQVNLCWCEPRCRPMRATQRRYHRSQ